MTGNADLERLNEQTFAAEDKETIDGRGWDEFLGETLADEFEIRRSNPALPNQRKQQMIDWIRDSPGRPRRLVGHSVRSWADDATGVVVCLVDVDDAGATKRYHNVKVFRRGDGRDWQCVYWQVTEGPAG